MKDERMVEVIRPKDGYTGLISKKTGRNELCACGSGRKAKRCCGVDTKYHSRQTTEIEDEEARKCRLDGVKY